MNQEEFFRERESLLATVAELQELKAKYESMVDAFDGLIYICSPDYKVEFMNSRFIERTGRNPVGEDCYKALHELESVCPWCVNERVFQGETVRWEVQSPKDQHWYYIVNTPIRHPDGSVSKMAMIQDVTEKKQSEEKLRKSENLYRQLIESASDIVYRTDRNGCFTLVNPVALRMSGYSRAELIGRRYLDLIVSEYRSAAERFYGVQLVKKTPNTYYEFPLLAKDGNTLWVGQNVQLLEEKGEIIGFQAIARDITARKRAEEELSQSSREWQETFTAVSDLIMVLDEKHRIIRLNKAMVDALGLTEAEIIGKPCHQVVHGEKFPPSFCPHTRLLADGNSHFADVEEPRLGGAFDIRVSPLRDEQGHVRGSVHVARNMTERQQLERLVLFEKERFESLAECSPFAMVIVGKNGQFEYVNPRFQEIFGYDLGDVPNGRAWFEKAYPDRAYRHETIAAWKEDLETLVPGGIRSRVFEVTCKDGSRKTIHFRPVKLGTGEDLMTCEDITDRIRAEEARRESEDRYRSLVETSPDPIIMYDLEGNLITVNQRAAKAYGVGSPEQLLAETKHIADLLDEEGQKKATANLQVILSTGSSKKSEYLLTRKDGSTFPVEINTSTVKSADGAPVAFISVVRDITDRKKVEQRIRESERKYRNLVEESFDGIFVQKGTKIVFANSRLCEMLGYSTRELVGKDHWVVYYPDFQEITRERAKARLQGQPVPSRYEVRLQRKDGASFEAEINARAVQVVAEPGIQVWVRDISERKQAETALRESEERFRTAFQTSPDSAAINRSSDGVYIEVNNGFSELSGFTREQVIGKSDLEINIWDDPGDRERLVAELKESGQVRNLEARFRPKDGSVRSGLVSARSIVLGGKSHILSVTRDVEDRKKAEQALRESEEKYRTLFEESQDAVYVSTRDGILVDANQAFLDLFGFDREEARNMDILRIYTAPADRKHMQEQIERKGSVKDYEIRFQKKDGTTIQGLLTSTVRREKDGTILGYQGIIRDVTDRRLLEKQLLEAQKMEAIGTLAGGIAHDFNNLLQVTMGYAEVLLLKKDNAHPEYSRLQKILKAGRSGAELVQRLLTLSRKTESKQRPVDLNHEIEQVRTLLNRTIPKMINIELLLGDALATVNADPTQVEQIIMNLAVNARDAMPEGGRLTLSTENVTLGEDCYRVQPGAKPGKYVLLAVSDTGCGMGKEILDHVFEPFFTTKDVGRGTGLGLAMVYGIVKQHGGHVTCESQPGHGTVFKVYLPAVEEQEIVSDESAEESELPQGRETLLLVDDDDDVRNLGELILSRSGYRVIAAKNGKEALEIYRRDRESISLVILDLIMPEMGGKQCMDELLRINPGARVLMASGYASGGTAKEAIALGARGFVNKPFSRAQLLQQVRLILDTPT